jgi:uncharacterized protein DUF6599
VNLRTKLRSLLICTAFAIGIASAPQSVFSANPPATDAAQQRLQQFLNAPLPPHTSAEGQSYFYKDDSLYQYIDGGADLYLLYDFQVLLHQDYKNGASSVTVDIYDMRNPEDAFGIYASERSPTYKFAAIGIEGYRSKGILNFVQDHYYVKLAGSGANAAVLLDQFATLLSQRIGGTRTLPALLHKLPQEHRVPHSEQYIRKDPLGHAFLAPAYVVAYGSGTEPSKLLVSVANEPAAAKSRLDQLAAHFRQTGECSPVPELGSNGIRAQNSFEGRLIAITHGRYVILLLNPPQNGPEILKAVAQALP